MSHYHQQVPFARNIFFFAGLAEQRVVEHCHVVQHGALRILTGQDGLGNPLLLQGRAASLEKVLPSEKPVTMRGTYGTPDVTRVVFPMPCSE